MDLNEIFEKRGVASIGDIGLNFVELYGGSIIEPTAFEPDPITHRQEYYYNAINNILYRKVVSKRDGNSVLQAYWQKVSQ